MLSETHGEFLTLHEIVAAAQKNLSEEIWDYLVGGTETETTVRRNRMALDSIAFRPRVLRDVSTIDVSGTLLGQQIRLPIALAPVGGLESFEPEGGATAAKAAARIQRHHGPQLRLQAGPGAEWRRRAGGLKIFQLYVRGDAAWIDEIVRRAIDNGYDAFCLTVDTAIYSRRERDIAKRFVKPWRARATGQHFQAGAELGRREALQGQVRYSAVLKGIATAEDAATRRSSMRRRGRLCLEPWRPAARPWPRLACRCCRRW